MKTSHTVEHEIKFSVQAFWGEEGGMGQDSYGSTVEMINEVLNLITLARVQFPKTNWVIVGDVETKVKK